MSIASIQETCLPREKVFYLRCVEVVQMSSSASSISIVVGVASHPVRPSAKVQITPSVDAANKEQVVNQ